MRNLCVEVSPGGGLIATRVANQCSLRDGGRSFGGNEWVAGIEEIEADVQGTRVNVSAHVRENDDPRPRGSTEGHEGALPEGVTAVLDDFSAGQRPEPPSQPDGDPRVGSLILAPVGALQDGA